MILNRIEDPKLFERVIRTEGTKIKPVEKVAETHNNPNKMKSRDGDTFEQTPSEGYFAFLLNEKMKKYKTRATL